MTSSPAAWLPDEGLFLEVTETPPARPHRPWNQGDIFEDVPISVTDRTGAGQPSPKLRPGYAALLGHTCSVRGGGTTAIMQNVAQVRLAKPAEAERLGAADPPWHSDFKLFPLEGLFTDALWVVDFSVLGSTHFKHLIGKRIACLSLPGWAAFQRRYANHSLRIDQSLDLRAADLKRLWTELEIWEEWCSRGLEEREFDSWLSRPIEAEGPYQGTVRRQAIELAADIIRGELPESPSSTA